jgi:hypothetical protein
MTRRALLVGNAKFIHNKYFSNLHTPVNDVNDFSLLLRNSGDYEIM